MFKKPVALVARHFFNYGFTALNIYDMAEKYDSFSCEELRKVLYLFKCDKEERSFEAAFENEELIGTMSRDAAIVCAVFLNLNLKIDDDMEEIDMCKAVEDMKQRYYGKGLGDGVAIGREEGVAIGREEGMAIGQENAFRGIVERLRKMNKSPHEICHLLGISAETVEQLDLPLQN